MPDKLYYAKGLEVWKSPVRTKVEGGESVSIGFHACTASEVIGEEGATAIAALLCLGEQAQNPSPQPNVTVEERSRMQLASGYLNSFETVIGALEKGGEQAQAAGLVAHGACLLHAAVELRHVWSERKERDSITQAEDLYEIAEALGCECDMRAILLSVAELKTKISDYRRELAATIREGISAVADARATNGGTQ